MRACKAILANFERLARVGDTRRFDFIRDSFPSLFQTQRRAVRSILRACLSRRSMVYPAIVQRRIISTRPVALTWCAGHESTTRVSVQRVHTGLAPSRNGAPSEGLWLLLLSTLLLSSRDDAVIDGLESKVYRPPRPAW